MLNEPINTMSEQATCIAVNASDLSMLIGSSVLLMVPAVLLCLIIWQLVIKPFIDSRFNRFASYFELIAPPKPKAKRTYKRKPVTTDLI